MRKRLEEGRKLDGAMCDGWEIVLHGRCLSIKEVVIFTDYLAIGVCAWIKPT